MAELDAIKTRSVVGIDGLVFRRDQAHRRGKVPLSWIIPRGDLDHFRSVVKDIIRAAGLRDELSFASFRHDGPLANRAIALSKGSRLGYILEQ